MDEELLLKEMKGDMNCLLTEFKKCHSKSRFFQLYEDYLVLADLFEIFIPDEIPELEDYICKSYESQIDPIYSKIKDNVMDDLSANINFYKKIANLYSLKKYCPTYQKTTPFLGKKSYVPEQESVELTLDFLEYYNKEMENIFIKLVKENRVIYGSNILPEGVYGSTFLLPTSQKAYIVLENKDILEDAFTIVHEIGHLYNFIKCKNLFPNAIRNGIYLNNFEETFPNFLELVFGQFLIEKYQFNEDVLTIYRNFDINLLDYLKDLQELFCDDTFDLNDFKVTYSNSISKIVAYHFYDRYLINPQKIKNNMNDFVLNESWHNDINRLNKYGITKEQLTNKKILKKYLNEHFKY